jgi:hypothetical protein
MLGDRNTKRRPGVKQERTTEADQRWRRGQAPIVDRPTKERLEKQPIGDRQRNKDVGITKAGPAREVSGAAELKPGQKVSPISRYTEVEPGRHNRPVDSTVFRSAEPTPWSNTPKRASNCVPVSTTTGATAAGGGGARSAPFAVGRVAKYEMHTANAIRQMVGHTAGAHLSASQFITFHCRSSSHVSDRRPNGR